MSTFTKHQHQFIYSTHLFNKIFIILLIFIVHSLTVPLSHKPTDPQPPSPPPSPPSHHHHHHQKPKKNHINPHIPINPREKSDSTSNQPIPINPHKEKSTPIKTPSSPCLHTYPDQPRPSKPTQTKTNPHHKLRLNHH